MTHSIVDCKGHRNFASRDVWAICGKNGDSGRPFVFENHRKACRNRHFFIDLCSSCKSQDWVAVAAVYCEPCSPIYKCKFPVKQPIYREYFCFVPLKPSYLKTSAIHSGACELFLKSIIPLTGNYQGIQFSSLRLIFKPFNY